MKTEQFLSLIIGSCMVLNACTNNNANDSVQQNNAGNQEMVSQKMDSLSTEDSEFVSEAASGGMMEVELGNLAQQKAASERVKNFGSMMVRDHTKANDELKAIAGGIGLSLPAEMGAKHRNMVNMLINKMGNDFDKQYMNMMVNDHQKDVAAFKKQADNGRNPDLKNFAANTLPVLQMHLDSAKSIDKVTSKLKASFH